MKTLELIRQQISTFERGCIFFISDIESIDKPDNVRTILSSLTAERFIFRLARGVYYYPRISDGYSPSVQFPSDDYIAHIISCKNKFRYVPSGEICSFKLGLSKFKLSDLTYYTDGAPRKIKLYNGHLLNFEHTSEVRIFAFKSQLLKELSLAIRSLGEEFSTTVSRKRIIKDLLNEVPEDLYIHDIKLMPAWVRSIVESIKG